MAIPLSVYSRGSASAESQAASSPSIATISSMSVLMLA
jgi:hypothetical protein